MKVLGIDPGTAACGYGIVQESGGRIRALDHGWWQTPAAERPELRLKTIFDRVQALIAEHEPSAVAVEESFVGADARIALSVGQARGAVLVAAAAVGVECVEYPPARVKQAVCGYGRAEKAQVQRMVRAILAMESNPTPSHAADALAVAICHALAPPLMRIARMISRLRGQLVGRTPDGFVLDVNGVGYLLAATPGAVRAAEGGGEAVVETYLHVREDALQLYGFADASERQLFLHLLTVAGIGPKVALAIVSGAPAADLRRAIVLQDAARFQAVPGVGKKTAERIVLELKEKLGAEDPVPISTAAGTSVHVTARDALVELGYSVLEAEQALASVDPDLPAEERVRLALRQAA